MAWTIAVRVILEAEAAHMRKETLTHAVVRSALKNLLVLQRIEPHAAVCFIGVHVWRICIGT
jgi:hypothetical protein